MDCRIHDRAPVTFWMRVTDVANPEFSVSGETIDISESGIGVYLPLQFAPGSLVRLNIKDSVLYGFVARSVPERSFFRTGIAVVQVSVGPSGLSQLLKATLETAMPTLKLTSTSA